MGNGDQVEGSSLTRARRQVLADTVSLIHKAYKEQREFDCYMLWESITDLEEQLWVNLNLLAGPRAAIKRFQEAERKANESHHQN